MATNSILIQRCKDNKKIQRKNHILIYNHPPSPFSLFLVTPHRKSAYYFYALKKLSMQRIAFLLLFLTCLFGFQFVNAASSADSLSAKKADTDSVRSRGRLTIGGYGEGVYKYNFYSDNVFRYSHADRYAQSKGHGRVDLPHAVFMLGYDFGHGWTFNTEVEFEHGGTESAVEVEAEESGEFEQEIERGGEVALEQFWLQKSFLDSKINIRAGHIVVPVGGTNNAHLPNEFFGVYRPEGENTIIPCTWHENGIELWGRIKGWRYDVMLIPALNSSMFNVSGWVHNGSASPYEFRVANKLAVPAARNLSDTVIQRGRQLFREIGCAHCHRPSWTTGPDRFTDPNGFFTTGDRRLPSYPHQKIWPYTDMIQHRLHMQNDIRTGWCRTTPLWGRGLSAICTGSADRMHDCRARNVIEAIMWHGNVQSDARRSVEQFRNLSKADRDAIVKFINAI